ncbi:VWA domain-containing protein [Rhizobium sp. KVB221]|uniref:VWA domain-containing protein n=2 Tax=Rhizobium setariae TaxID=2801340 RepID=A0A936YS08_9HYPH|nr:VWA domain-containing protein [Rhizobium setariae]
MMENELDKLGRMTSPQPSDAARQRALAAAMSAFDAEEKVSLHTKGTQEIRRQSSILTQMWSSIMNKRLLAGSALATLIVLPAAGYITIGMLHDRSFQLGEMPVLADKDAGLESGNVGKKPEPATQKMEELAGAGDASKAVPTAAGQGRSDVQQPVVDSTQNQAVAELPKPAPAADASDLTAETETAPVDALSVARPMTVQPTGAMRKKMSIGTSMESQGVVAPSPTILQKDAGDRFTSKEINPVHSVATDPVSTFSIDVDTASYAYTRQAIMSGHLPEPDSVRVEEMINYFPYDWKPPQSADQAFNANITVMPTPWNTHTQLMHIGIKGYEIQQQEQRPANLVFLIDVSGSMDDPNKLPLLKSAFRLLVGKLKPDDTVSIVVYAGNSGVVLEPTKAADKSKILAAIDNLQPGGSTAGAEGIEAAYRLAEKAFVKNGVNRIFLATDGDFNVGPSSDEDLKKMIEAKRKTGIFLSVLGFGTGNYNDGLMQTLAQNGNGVAAYIDTLSEAQKTLVQEATASLFPIAKDVKIQVEFNPEKIAEYRLIGYETRALKREDFNNDKIDAGEIGSGHRVTAIYEVTPKGSPAVLNDDLRYAEKKQDSTLATDVKVAASDELAFVKIRYKKPDEDKSNLITMPVRAGEAKAGVDDAAGDVRFSVAVAAFGQKLKGENQLSDYSWDSILKLGTDSRGMDPFGYRAEFLKLVELSKSLKGE